MTKNQIDYFGQREQQRHNVVSEQLTSEANAIAAQNVAVQAARVAEDTRHNLATEQLTSVKNANDYNVSMTKVQNEYQVAMLNQGESVRTHMANEDLTKSGQRTSTLNTVLTTLGNITSGAVRLAGTLVK